MENWRDIETVIQEDQDAEAMRLQKESLRSRNISNSWKDLWEAVVACLTSNAEELSKKLHNRRIIAIGDDLWVVMRDENHCSFENSVFPQIRLDIRCSPGKSIIVTGEKGYSAFRSEKIEPRRYNFEADRNYQAYLAGEIQGCFNPSQVADSLTGIVAEFFREIATR